MEYTQFITETGLILIAVVYVLGMVLKGTKKIPDAIIPIILLPIGILLSMWTFGKGPDALIQGVLITGAAVYTNQLIKQTTKAVKSEDIEKKE